jgi:apolipoprotein N-acyltransferase
LVVFAGIDRLAVATILSFGWRRALTAFVAGAVSALAMAPFDLFPLLFLTFPVLVWLIDSTISDPARHAVSRLWSAFRTGWWFGFGYLLAGMWWIGNAFLVEAEQFAWMLPFAVIALPAFLAIFFGIGTAIARIFWKPGWRRVLALALGLSVAEYLRGTVLTGFPWNAIGYGALTMPATMQKASVLGIYGVTLAAIPFFSMGALLAAPRGGQRRRVFLPVVLVLAAIGADFGFGYWRLGQLPQGIVENVNLRLVQPAIDQAEKWTPELRERNFETLLEMSRGGEAGETKLGSGSVLIWPESSFPFILTERRDALAALAELLPDGAMLIAGAIRTEPDETAVGGMRAFNSVYLIDSDGVIAGASDKVHLVPFGEYLPFQHFAERAGLMQLTHLRGGFLAGRQRELLDAGPAGKAAPLICYEIIFPGAIDTAERPGWLLNLTNDAWFGLTPGPYQHWRQAVVRGVEEGLPVVRVANSGISSVSDSGGRIVASLGLGRRGTLDTTLPVAGPPTIYARYGNLTFMALIVLITVPLLFPARVR